MNSSAARQAPGGSSAGPPMISGPTNTIVIAVSMHHSCGRVPQSPIQNTQSSATGAIPDGPPAARRSATTIR